MIERTILITGANGQIGSRISRHLLSAGKYRLVLLYHENASRLHDLRFDPAVLALSCDLSDTVEVKETIDRVFCKWNTYPDILIHTAAIRSYDAELLCNSDPGLWKHIFQSNIDLAYNTLHTLLPHMRSNQFGRIVIFGSHVTHTGLVRGSAYAAAKSALINLVKTIAKEHGRDNILINAISPAPVDTDLDADYEGSYKEFRKRYFDQFLLQVPTGKLVSISEICETVNLLISDKITGINGMELYLNGGNW